MTNKRSRIIAWGLTSTIIAVSVINTIVSLVVQPTGIDPLETLGWGLTMPLVFSVLAAMIIARQPRNRVGWLMMIIGLAGGLNSLIQLVMAPYTFSPPDQLTLGLWLMI